MKEIKWYIGIIVLSLTALVIIVVKYLHQKYEERRTQEIVELLDDDLIDDDEDNPNWEFDDEESDYVFDKNSD